MDDVRDNDAGGSAAADVIYRVLYDVTTSADDVIVTGWRLRKTS